VNVHEERAWKILVELGARELTIFGKHALDLSTIRATSKNKVCLLIQATIDVVGKSGANRRHMDGRGLLVYVVTDFYTVGSTDFYTVGSTDRNRHDAEIKRMLARKEAE
jgi:hypothetical protein